MFWSTACAQQFQLFHPIGGVSAMRSPQTIRKFLSDCPHALRACRVTGYSPAVASVPVIRPSAAFTASPAGRPATLNSRGRSPVAGIV